MAIFDVTTSFCLLISCAVLAASIVLHARSMHFLLAIDHATTNRLRVESADATGDIMDSKATPTEHARDTFYLTRTMSLYAWQSLSAQLELTEREAEILPLLACGWSMNFIANQMHLSTSTVKTHTQCIYRKADVHSRDDLIDYVESHLPSVDPSER